MARTGTQFRELLKNLSGAKREALIRQALDAGEIPSWFWIFSPITSTQNIDGKLYELTYWVSQLPLAIGTDADYMFVRPWPSTFQWFADKNGLIMPTTRMSDQIYASAPYKFVPQPVHPHSIATDSWFRSDDNFRAQAAKLGYMPGMGIAAGFMKDVVNGPNLSGKQVAIYGWHDPTKLITGSNPIQSYSTIHEATFSDYSHEARGVKRMGSLSVDGGEGSSVDLGTIAKDPKLYTLIQKSPSEAVVSGEGGPLTNDRFPILDDNSPTDVSLMALVPSAFSDDGDDRITSPGEASPSAPPSGNGGGGSGIASASSGMSVPTVLKWVGGVTLGIGGVYLGTRLYQRYQSRRG